MRNLNRQINLFVALQILCGLGWILVSNYVGNVLDPVAHAVQTELRGIGLSGLPLAFAHFFVFVGGMLGMVVGTLIWIMSGSYRRGIGTIAFVMGVGVLFGAAARYMRPINELDTMGYLLVGRAVLVLIVYMSIAAVVASQVLEWVADKALADANVKIRLWLSIPLCTILPVAHLWIGYVETMQEQFVVLAIGSLVLVAFTAWTNRQRTHAYRLLAARATQDDANNTRSRVRDRRNEFTQFRT